MLVPNYSPSSELSSSPESLSCNHHVKRRRCGRRCAGLRITRRWRGCGDILRSRWGAGGADVSALACAGVGVVDDEALEAAAARTAFTCAGVGVVDDEDLEGSVFSGSCTAASEGGGYR